MTSCIALGMVVKILFGVCHLSGAYVGGKHQKDCNNSPTRSPPRRRARNAQMLKKILLERIKSVYESLLPAIKKYGAYGLDDNIDI